MLQRRTNSCYLQTLNLNQESWYCLYRKSSLIVLKLLFISVIRVILNMNWILKKTNKPSKAFGSGVTVCCGRWASTDKNKMQDDEETASPTCPGITWSISEVLCLGNQEQTDWWLLLHELVLDTTLLSAGEVTTELHRGVSALCVLQQLLTTHSSGT